MAITWEMKRKTLCCGQMHTIGRNTWICFLCWDLLQFSSVTQSCPTLCDPMNRSTPGLPVHHQLPEFTQTHVCWVGDAVQPSPPLSSPSPPAFKLQMNQLFTSSGQSIGVSTSSVLPMNTQDWSPLGWAGWVSLISFGDFKRCKSVLTEPLHSHTAQTPGVKWSARLPRTVLWLKGRGNRSLERFLQPRFIS